MSEHTNMDDLWGALARLDAAPVVFLHPDDLRAAFSPEEIAEMEADGRIQWHSAPEAP